MVDINVNDGDPWTMLTTGGSSLKGAPLSTQIGNLIAGVGLWRMGGVMKGRIRRRKG
jgi:hypothetical protein